MIGCIVIAMKARAGDLTIRSSNGINQTEAKVIIEEPVISISETEKQL